MVSRHSDSAVKVKTGTHIYNPANVSISLYQMYYHVLWELLLRSKAHIDHLFERVKYMHCNLCISLSKAMKD